MTESALHNFLKHVGKAFLFNQRCFLVATEVFIFQSGEELCAQIEWKMKMNNANKRKHIYIDVLGFGEKYIPYGLRRYEEGAETTPESSYKYNILRGIEVKVSRSDFRNGFIMSGCNYHYLFTPKGLIDRSEVPKHMGVIEVDMDKFKCHFNSLGNKFHYEGLKVIRAPRFRKIRHTQIDSGFSRISARCARELITLTAERLKRGLDG